MAAKRKYTTEMSVSVVWHLEVLANQLMFLQVGVYSAEVGMGWVDPWVELDWVGSCWVGILTVCRGLGWAWVIRRQPLL
jgi:hypothetical protein